MSNKLSVSRVVLLGSTLASIALVVAGMVLSAKPAWMDIATPLSVVLTLWMLWHESRKFSFDAVAVGGSAPAGDQNASSPLVHLASDQIRVFGSLEDGQRHGWSFEEEIGRLGSTTLYLWAEFEGKKWRYDGLNASNNDAVIPEDMRVFGKVRYTESEVSSESVTNKQVAIEKTQHALPSLNPALHSQ